MAQTFAIGIVNVNWGEQISDGGTHILGNMFRGEHIYWYTGPKMIGSFSIFLFFVAWSEYRVTIVWLFDKGCGSESGGNKSQCMN